ncbi:polysaccharide deacetylase family protein [Halocatena pleomorpha]|uniref:Polysaccharide deacetylase n=1 Tax=Halocatena pleomorpha TaxID=1785090 RepID=A0A3P3RGE9_9EURY|nr:polysaccharide deacetylase family protein [Halocatena pleomorpha]RRJ31820.1 polysaccharide deacetylase [Halocatena pleomorpha]
MIRGSTRRGFLVTVGAGTASLAGCFTQQGDNDRDGSEPTRTSDRRKTDQNGVPVEKGAVESVVPPENGAVVFVYDDGPMTDYTEAFPAHQSYDAPATVGIVSEWVGRTNFMEREWMDVDHLTKLVDAGWEIASHTAEHTTVGTYELVEDVAPTDERVYPTAVRHGFWTPKDVEITTGDRTVRTSAVGRGSDDIGRYVELGDPVGASFAAEEAVIRYPPSVMEHALARSKRDLEGFGFDVKTFLAPYDDFDAWSQRFVDDFYIGVANGDHGNRINDPDAFSPYQTRRAYFVEFTEPKFVKRDLDAIANRGALGVFGAHTHKDSVTKDRIRTTLEWVEKRNIEVMTLRDAIEIYA